MQPISQDFAPPFKLVAPYFIIGALFFILCALFLFTLDIQTIGYLNSEVLSLTHLFLLGFVMMIIFGAMAQLIPVTLEVGHFSVELYYVIWPLLLVGTLLMGLGFYFLPSLLPYGGVIVLISMFIFLSEVFLTIRKVKTFNNVIKSLVISNLFLLFGVIVGIILALGYAGEITVDLTSLLKMHVFFVVVGYIITTIMALSLILLPMFGLSHNFSQKPLNLAVILNSIAVVDVFLANMFGLNGVDYLGYILSIISMILFMYQVVLIYQTRARKENDIYVYHLFFSFFTLSASLLLGCIYLINSNENLLLTSGFLMFFGFFTFVIIGHMYKIVPFLVWFEKFAPLVGKEPVPMLADMLPVKAANVEFTFLSIGVSLISIALLFSNEVLFNSGASFFFIGAVFIFKNLIYMIRFK